MNMANDLIRDSLTDQNTCSHYIASEEKTSAFFEVAMQKQGEYNFLKRQFFKLLGKLG
jgi:hypothetical protein